MNFDGEERAFMLLSRCLFLHPANVITAEMMNKTVFNNL